MSFLGLFLQRVYKSSGYLLRLLQIGLHTSFSQIDKIDNNDNIDIRGFSTWKKSNDKMSPPVWNWNLQSVSAVHVDRCG